MKKAEAKKTAAVVVAIQKTNGAPKPAAKKAAAAKPAPVVLESELVIEGAPGTGRGKKSDAPKFIVAMDTGDRKRANQFQDALTAANISCRMGRERGKSQVWIRQDAVDAAKKVLDTLFQNGKSNGATTDQGLTGDALKAEKAKLKAADREKRSAAKAAKAAERAAARENRRVTPGTPLKEWRVVKSQRVGRPGYFLQGGIHKPGPKGPKSFFVGEETLYESADEAKKALEARRAK